MSYHSITLRLKKLLVTILIFIIITLILDTIIISIGTEPNWIYKVISFLVSLWISKFIYHMIFMVMVNKVTIIEFNDEYYHFLLNYQMGFKRNYDIVGLIKSTENKPLNDKDILLILHEKLSKKLFKRCKNKFCEINDNGKYLLKLNVVDTH